METVTPHETEHSLHSELTVHSITDSLKNIQEIIRGGGDVKIDLTPVRQLDTCGMQLLLVACQVVRQEGRVFQLTGNVFEDVQQFVNESGFKEQFEDMLV